jgi:hypothetical protein
VHGNYLQVASIQKNGTVIRDANRSGAFPTAEAAIKMATAVNDHRTLHNTDASIFGLHSIISRSGKFFVCLVRFIRSCSSRLKQYFLIQKDCAHLKHFTLEPIVQSWVTTPAFLQRRE